jgi:hypothetical protein
LGLRLLGRMVRGMIAARKDIAARRVLERKIVVVESRMVEKTATMMEKEGPMMARSQTPKTKTHPHQKKKEASYQNRPSANPH